MPNADEQRDATPVPQEGVTEETEKREPTVAEVAARAMSDADLTEAIEATDTVHSHILPPRSVHDAIRLRAADESVIPVNGKRVSISKGEMVAFLWTYFEQTYGPPNGEVARYVAELRAEFEARLAEGVRRGLVSADRAERERAARERADD